MKTMVTVILMLVGFLTLIAPECPGPLVANASQSTVSAALSDSGPTISSASGSSEHQKHTSHPDDCDDCGNPNHACHHCHFGHCGFITSLAKFSPFDGEKRYGRTSQNFDLKSFIASLFRPPIA